MALGDYVKNMFSISRKTFVNPRGWLDYDALNTQSRALWGTLKRLFIPDKPAREETFEAAMERLNLTEADIQSQIKAFRSYALLFLVVGLIVLLYSFFLLFTGVWTGWILGIAVSGLFFAQAYKYDFWSFQLRRRKLGATFAEWKKNILGETGDSP